MTPLGEKALIERIRSLARGDRGIRTGIGDDAAVLRLPTGHEALVTTDFSLEGIHFRRAWHSPEVVGRRCLTRGLSDIAAMGGRPIAAFLSLALPRKTPQAWVDNFLKGLLELGDEFGVTLAGGDTAESPGPVLADIVVLGAVPSGTAVLRSTAKIGDEVYVTGELGGSATALASLFKGKRLNQSHFPRHFHPQPRIEIGQHLREKGWASAMIDTSDGLSTDLAHLCEESGVGAEIYTDAIPRSSVGRASQAVDLNLALHGGEDYELLFTASAQKRLPQQIAGVAVRKIGRMVSGKGMWLIDAAGRKRPFAAEGWQHFSR